MAKRQSNAMLIALFMFMQCLYGFTLSSTVNATEISGNILDSVTMAVYDSHDAVVTGNVYDQDGKVKLDYTWSLPNGHGYHAGDTFSFILPQEFVLFNNVSGPLTTTDNGPAGTFVANKDTHRVVITFNSFIESHDNLQGTLSFLTQISTSRLNGSTEQTIVIPIRSGDQVFSFKLRPWVTSTISKSGVPEGYNPKSISWTVDVNQKLDEVQQAVVTDPIPAGLTAPAPAAVSVYHLQMQLDGTSVQGAQLDPSEYTVSSDGGVLTVHFTSSPITSAYRIHYSTAITDMARTTFTNTATFGGSNKEGIQAKSTVEVGRGKLVWKESTDYIAATQRIEWAIHYNGGEVTIPQSAAYLIDTFNTTHELVPGSLQVQAVTFDVSGHEIVGATVSPGEYTVTPLEGANGFKLQFNHDISSAYRIVYQIQAKTPILQDAVIENKVTTGNQTETAIRTISQRALVKDALVDSVDYQTRTIAWKIEINGDSQFMTNIVLTDTFPNKGLQFNSTSLVVKTKVGVTLLPVTDFTIDPSVDAKDGFILHFTHELNEPVVIVYQTTFNLDWIPPGGMSAFFNHAKLEFLFMDTKYTAEAGAAYYPNAELQQNGYKFGSFEWRGKDPTLTWTVGINYRGKSLAHAALVDVLESNQKLIKGSVAVYHMTIAPNGSPSQGAAVAASEYTVNEDDPSKPFVTFNQPIQDGYIVIFQTSLKDQIIPSSVANTAKLTNGESQVSSDLYASVAIPHGGEYLIKNGSQNGDKINWNITINRGQSTLTEAEVYDHPSSNQELLPDSFHLYATTVGTNGDLVRDVELVKGTGYTVTIQTNQQGQQTFLLKFLSPISAAYILEYQSLIHAGNGDTVNNAVSFSGKNVTTITKETSQEIVVGVTTGSGTGTGVRGSLQVMKIDASNREQPLAGATYNLYRVSRESRDLIQTQTTNASGIAIFQGLLAGDYVIKEITAPSGYILDAADHPFTLQPAENKRLTYTNSKTTTPPPSSTPTPPPSSTPTPTPPPSSSPTPPPSSPTPSPSVTPSPKPTPPVVTVPSPKPTDPGSTPVPPVPSVEPATLPVTGESSHLYIKLSGVALVLFGIMAGRKVRRKR
ncbi:collagen binding domain-containing protein [Paenibacillus roseipurpureus]|uniref:Collagen binding domain-containing protein n=1 Tax=Paenibacillus roseopurpureus TaxID=2918901 RepID=A0AA96LPD7_9BACL|nr:collagen binding domain-containing protein [Paenibacillus sp. MBLB1832]WNR44783.1 collagen binding domain-containing protein [Paenibacillus sp. MBLB1832]